MTTRTYPEPVNFKDDRGAWKSVDPTLRAAPDGTVHPSDVDGDVAIPSSLNEPLTVKHGNRSLSFRLQGAAGDPGGDRSTEGPKATFDDAIDGVAVEYSARSQGLKETLVLDSRGAPHAYSYDVVADDNLIGKIDAHGDFVLDDAMGTTQFRVSAPLAYDAGQPAAFSNALQLTSLARSPGRWTVTMRASDSWLNDPARTYPVSLDPSFYWVTPDTERFDGAAQDCYLIGGSSANGNTCAFDSLALGYINKASRPLLRFDVAAAIPADANITDARLAMYLASGLTSQSTISSRVHTVTSDWNNGATWNERKPGTSWSAAGGDVSAASDLTGAVNNSVGNNSGYWYFWNVPTKAVQGWVSGSIQNFGLQVKAVSETSDTGQFFFSSSDADASTWPALDVTWSYLPHGATTADTFLSGHLGDPAERTVSLSGTSALDEYNVNVASGNLLVREQDHVGSAPELIRYYNSGAMTDLGFGQGWRQSKGPGNRLTVLSSGDLQFADATGANHVFARTSPTTFSPPTSAPDDTLTLGSDGRVTVVDASEDATYEFASLVSGSATKYTADVGSSTTIKLSGAGTVDAMQGTTVYSRNSAGKIATITAPNGRQYGYTYNPDGRVVSFTGNGGASSSTYGYDTAGRLNRVTRSTGWALSISYVGSSRRVAQLTKTSPGGSQTISAFAYSGSTTTVQVAGVVKTFTIDAAGRVAAQTQSAGPGLTVSGSLWSAGGSTLTPGDYSVALSSQMNGSDGVRQLGLWANGQWIDGVERDCTLTTCASAASSFTVNSQALPSGLVKIAVVAVSQTNKITQSFIYLQVPSASPTAPADSPDPDPTPTQVAAAAANTRQALNLDSSPSAINAAASSPTATRGLAAYGIPLVQAELDQLKARDAIQSAQADAVEYINAHYPQDFAGSYIDSSVDASGRLYVGFTDHMVDHSADVRAHFAFPDRVKGFDAAYSRAKLAAVVDRVNGDSSVLASQGISIDGASVDEKSNRVEIDVTGKTAAIESALVNEYGGSVRVAETPIGYATSAPANRWQPTKQQYAGQLIRSFPANGFCTLAFGAIGDPKLQVTLDDTGGFGGYLIWKTFYLTAGHCVVLPFPQTSMTQAYKIFSKVVDYNFFQKTAADAGLLRPNDVKTWSSKVYTNPGQLSPVYRYEKKGTPTKGLNVCFMTRDQLQRRCGIVVNSSRIATLNYGTESNPLRYTIKALREVNVPCVKGDSGGAVWHPIEDDLEHRGFVRAEGIVTGNVSRDVDGNAVNHCVYANVEHAIDIFDDHNDIQAFQIASSGLDPAELTSLDGPAIPEPKTPPTFVGCATLSASCTVSAGSWSGSPSFTFVGKLCDTAVSCGSTLASTAAGWSTTTDARGCVVSTPVATVKATNSAGSVYYPIQGKALVDCSGSSGGGGGGGGGGAPCDGGQWSWNPTTGCTYY